MMIKLVKNFEKQRFERKKEKNFSTNYNMNMTFSKCPWFSWPAIG